MTFLCNCRLCFYIQQVIVKSNVVFFDLYRNLYVTALQNLQESKFGEFRFEAVWTVFRLICQ